jgi:hypothetical protein
VPLSMCDWKSYVDDTRGCHWTSSQAEPTSVPEAIEDQPCSGGSCSALSLTGAFSDRHRVRQ